jgi:ADP-heptose:LPS heptosyltransferase
MAIDLPDCKKFTGYKPCHPGKQGETCIEPEPAGVRILIINLGALGALLMTTTILPALKRKYPQSTIHWLTERRGAPLLYENPFIDFIHEWGIDAQLTLQAMRFDVVCNGDKISEMCALTNLLNAKTKLGFGLNEDGVIIPLNRGAEYNYKMGIDNNLKFKKNVRTYPDIIRETFELDKDIDSYIFHFTDDERSQIDSYKNNLAMDSEKLFIGINTGCSNLFPNKRPPEGAILKLIDLLRGRDPSQPILLLGGLEDTERNNKIARDSGKNIINTPTTEGLRRGMGYVDLCDIVFTGDSFGMHMAIALKKQVIAWFNVTCSPEIELYGRGAKITSEVDCSPCWKQVCDVGLVCLDEDIGSTMIGEYDKLMQDKD